MPADDSDQGDQDPSPRDPAPLMDQPNPPPLSDLRAPPPPPPSSIASRVQDLARAAPHDHVLHKVLGLPTKVLAKAML
eukprot:14001571-Alexandrium_andersonii.AAC.1